MNLNAIPKVAHCTKNCISESRRNERELTFEILHWQRGTEPNREQVFIVEDLDFKHSVAEYFRVVEGFQYQHKNWELSGE